MKKFTALVEATRDGEGSGIEVLTEALWARQFELLGALATPDHRVPVVAGPFAGLRQVTEVYCRSDMVGKALGLYERELHPVMERIIASDYSDIINIGCADGYYAVGLALRMPQARIHAFDIVERERQWCALTAKVNGVSNIQIGERFEGAAFAAFPAGKTLVLCDIEGAELDLLDPERFPALAGFDIVVEMHDCYNPDISAIMQHRFAPSHTTTIIPNAPLAEADLRPWLPEGTPLHPFDGLLAGWDSRVGATPWGDFQVRR